MSVRKSNFDVFGVLFTHLRSFRMATLESGSTEQIEKCWTRLRLGVPKSMNHLVT